MAVKLFLVLFAALSLACVHSFRVQVPQRSVRATALQATSIKKTVTAGLAAFGIFGGALLAPAFSPPSFAADKYTEALSDLKYADEVESSKPLASAESVGVVVQKVPLMTKRTAETIVYSDVNRGFKLLRPFGFNEFEGNGGGYLMKFASLYDVDENVVIGSAPASAGKSTIADYGTVEKLGEKLATKRKGTLLSSKARETDGFLFYEFEFETPLVPNLPRPGARDATKGIELYELVVAKGRLWSVQATSNDILFEKHEKYLRPALASFVPRL